jgi:hypothetical protein
LRNTLASLASLAAPISRQQLSHWQAVNSVGRNLASVAAAFVEPNRISSHIGTDFVTTLTMRKRFRQQKQSPPMTTPLTVLAYGNSAKPCYRPNYINANDADYVVLVKKDHRMVAVFEFVRMILVILAGLAAFFKEYFASYGVIGEPILAITW